MVPLNQNDPMHTDESIALHRVDAKRVRDRLHRLVSRLPPDGPARPGELTVSLSRLDVRHGAAMFVCMAGTAVARKYEAAGLPEPAARLAWFIDQATIGFNQARYGMLGGEAQQRRHAWIVARKRLGAHASRCSYGDPDLGVALASLGALGHWATPWICQQPDWRFRWTPDGRRRLDFVVDCWDAYSR